MNNQSLCQWVLEFADAYLDRELDEQSLDVITQHLETCARCKSHIECERLVKESIARSQQANIPSHLEKRITQAISNMRVEWNGGVIYQRTIKIEWRDE
jgi:mycothiol system anti-sigma-R factor